MLSTVNVIEMGEENSVMQLKSFPDTPEGNAQAENLFKGICRESASDTSDEAIARYVEDGTCEVGGGCVLLVHST